ncbi:hypothetical protein A9Q75_04170 [Colwellia psychrerythraea]|uniref:Bacterial EndoU nuclease domain-containing protein n=1 Tax=Colwellia psychrerythraea TaxID=28229 RepID=A0A1Y5EQU7_COLPS|nr:hypothetical protein A9Q75_04170 [Colwellia psychrerythraea]
MDKRINSTVYVAIITLIGGIAAAVVTSIYQDEVSKREISLRTISLLAQDLLQAKPIILSSESGPEHLNRILQHKEAAFLAKGLTQHLKDNHKGMDFKILRSSLSSVERRYSYAQLYQTAKVASIICENLTWDGESKPIWISGRLSKCKSSLLDGIILSVKKIDPNNFRFHIDVSNDKGGAFCLGEDDFCDFWIDLGDRLESTSYKYLILAEYIGYEDIYNQKIPMVTFSVVLRKNPVIDFPKMVSGKGDDSYWDYKYNNQKAIIEQNENQLAVKCEPFFDHDSKTSAAPEPPIMTNFGDGIVRACGAIGGKVSSHEFEALIDDNWNSLIKLYPRDWSILPKKEIVSKLKQIWLTQDGFNHVFCGDWDDGLIGGLHFRGRYLQLQNEGKACYKESPDEEVIDGKIYTIGVVSKDGSNRHYKKGYALKQSGLDLFSLGITAFEYCNNDANWKPYKSNFDKVFYINDTDEKVDYQVICKAKDPLDKLTYGILTIYPDATPNKSATFSVSKND